jgi:hypothetical protein
MASREVRAAAFVLMAFCQQKPVEAADQTCADAML